VSEQAVLEIHADPATIDTTFDNNLYWAGDIRTENKWFVAGAGKDWAQWQAVYSQDRNGMIAAPGLVSLVGRDYHLVANSSAVDAGNDAICPDHDFDNAIRAGVCDIGAYTKGTTGGSGVPNDVKNLRRIDFKR